MALQLTCSDLDTAARTVWGEARGEDYEGQVAVAHVLLNRVKARHRREHTLSGVCLEPFQFSTWNENDPNRDKLMRLGPHDRAYMVAYRAVLDAVLDLEDDQTLGATHYHALGVSPNWAVGEEPSAVIGRHLFYVGIR